MIYLYNSQDCDAIVNIFWASDKSKVIKFNKRNDKVNKERAPFSLNPPFRLIMLCLFTSRNITPLAGLARGALVVDNSLTVTVRPFIC